MPQQFIAVTGLGVALHRSLQRFNKLWLREKGELRTGICQIHQIIYRSLLKQVRVINQNQAGAIVLCLIL